MTANKQKEVPKANKEAKKESDVPYQMLSVSKEGIPSFTKIVITDDV